MAPTPSIKVTKRFLWGGVTREFSNRYHFNGGLPADATHWTTLSDAVVNAEKACFANFPGNPVSIVKTTGYAAGSDVPVFTKAYTTVGTLSLTGLAPVPAEVAGLVRYTTTARTSKNHPVYLYNYYHGVYCDGVDGDTWIASQRTAFSTYATAWISGFSDGAITAVRAGPNGATATTRLIETRLTHRDFPRG
jgi:hypothetical protein